jgi:hypothetical protein
LKLSERGGQEVGRKKTDGLVTSAMKKGGGKVEVEDTYI